MTDKVNFKIEGLGELKRFLRKELPESIQRNAALAGMRVGAKEMARAAQDRVPMNSAALAGAIKSKTVRKRDPNFAALVVAPLTNQRGPISWWLNTYVEGNGRYGKGWSVKPKQGAAGQFFYGRFLEFGYYNKLLGRQMPGHFFMRNAFDTKEQGYRNDFADNIRKKAIAAAKRHNAKSKANNKRNSI